MIIDTVTLSLVFNAEVKHLQSGTMTLQLLLMSTCVSTTMYMSLNDNDSYHNSKVIVGFCETEDGL